MSNFDPQITVATTKAVGHGAGSVTLQASSIHPEGIWFEVKNDGLAKSVLLVDDRMMSEINRLFDQKRGWQRSKKSDGARTLDDAFKRIEALEAALAAKNAAPLKPSLDDIDPMWDDNIISTIKAVREKTGAGLKESKEKVESWFPKWTENGMYNQGSFVRSDGVLYRKDKGSCWGYPGDTFEENHRDICGWTRVNSL